MSFLYWPKVAVLALLPVAAIAQQVRPANPADANAAVREAGYVSAFGKYRIAVDDQETPDRAWRAANEEVGRSDPHAGHMAMPGMKAQPGTQHASPTQTNPHAEHMAMPGIGAKPTGARSTSTSPNPHDGHGGHTDMQGKQ